MWASFESVTNIGTVNIKKLVTPTLILILIFLTTVLITSLSQVAHAQMITCPNTSPNDLDGDGISNIQETKGIDSNNDGHVDLNLTALGANPLHKDIFLEVDYMKHHKPSQAGIDNLTKTFQNAPVCNPDGVTGIALHTRVDDEVPHIDVLPIECVQGGDWSGFNSLKKTFFGTVEDRHDPNARNILAAKDFLNHYAIFIHQYTNQYGKPSGSSGCSDPPRMNMVVSLGGWQDGLGRDPNTNDVLSNPDYEVGTLMHELGHTLNLGHGGSDWNTNYMPNYLSIMNYNFQFPSPVGTRPLDYSRCAITTLDENNLDEHRALGSSCPPGLYSWSGYHNGDQKCPPDKLLITNSSFDWNDNGESSDSRVNKDVNCDHSLTKMKGYDDWHHISYIRDRNNAGSNVGGMGSAQGQQPYSHEDRTVQSVLDDRGVLLSNLNETTKGLPPPIQEFYSGQIGLSNATNGTEITIPSNASTGVVVSNATGSFVIQNASSITIPSNASTGVVVSNATGSFVVQNGTKLKNSTDTTGVPDNATVGNSSGVIVSNATHATVSNSSGVVVSNATGSFVVNNASSIAIPSNATSGGTVKNTTTLADLIVKSNDIPGAIKKIDKLAKTADSSVGGESNGDLVVDPVSQKKMTAELDNLKSVLAKQASPPASSSSGIQPSSGAAPSTNRAVDILVNKSREGATLMETKPSSSASSLAPTFEGPPQCGGGFICTLWKIDANGLFGTLIINSVDDKGKLNGRLFDHPINGSWNQYSKKITFEELDSPTTKQPLATYTGYLHNMCGSINIVPDCLFIGGSFVTHQQPQEAGWFAEIAKNPFLIQGTNK